MKWLGLAALTLLVALIFWGSTSLPRIGDPEAPANVHVSPYYIENTLEDMGTPNIVTSVLADYRGYDTFGETVVIFAAGLASILILWRGKGL